MLININELLTLVLIIALIILIIIFMAVGIKLIGTLKKIDTVIEDVNGKMNKVNGVFDIIDKTTDYASAISDKVTKYLSNIVSAVFKKRKGNDEDE